MTADNTLQRRRYNLLKALQKNDPESEILKDAIAPIEDTHNWDWDQPLASGAMAANIAAFSGDPFAPGALKETTAEEFVARLVGSQRQSRPAELVPPLLSVQELTRRDFDWGHGIARELARREQWAEPVWKDIISGWRSADLGERQCRTMLEWFSNREVFTNHAGDVAESLHRLVRNGGKPYAIGLIDEAEQAALPLWQHIRCDEQMAVSGWHDAAFNSCNVGYLTRFWLDATEIRSRTSSQPTFSSTCMRGLTQIIRDDSLKGDLGTAVLAGQTDFLLQMQQPWTELFFQPVFTRGGRRERAAWGGLVETQNITPGVARALGETLQEKFTELIGEPVNNTRQREAVRRNLHEIPMLLRARPRAVAQSHHRQEQHRRHRPARASLGEQTQRGRSGAASGLVAPVDAGLLGRPQHRHAQTDQPGRRHANSCLDRPPHRIIRGSCRFGQTNSLERTATRTFPSNGTFRHGVETP